MHDCKAPSLREGWGGLPLPKQGGLGWVSSLGLLLGSPFNPSPQHPIIKRVTPQGEVFLFVATL